MKLYALFVAMAAVTVLSPGPGVVMTLSNALRFGFRPALGGILGIATGASVVAAVSATSAGALLASSALAFTLLKLVGAAYLIYLGIKLWRSPPFVFNTSSAPAGSFGRRFAEGLSLQFTNPKAIFFFLSVFPQFIDPAQPYASQFMALVLTYSALVVLIHSGYALFARGAQRWLRTERGGRQVNRVAGTTFVAFGLGLAMAKRAA